MKVHRGYKVALDLNNEQRTACFKHAGCSRFAWNWGLARKREAYQQTGKTPSAVDLHKELNTLKKTEYPWMYDVSKCAPQEALRDLDGRAADARRPNVPLPVLRCHAGPRSQCCFEPGGIWLRKIRELP